MGEIFESAVRSADDLAGVFEYDGEVAFFYLYETSFSGGNKIVGAIRISAGKLNLTAKDVLVQWDAAEQYVGLWLKGRLWAAFDAQSQMKYGGDYVKDAIGTVPDAVARRFAVA